MHALLASLGNFYPLEVEYVLAVQQENFWRDSSAQHAQPERLGRSRSAHALLAQLAHTVRKNQGNASLA
jgi:hypothetical protein